MVTCSVLARVRFLDLLLACLTKPDEDTTLGEDQLQGSEKPKLSRPIVMV